MWGGVFKYKDGELQWGQGTVTESVKKPDSDTIDEIVDSFHRKRYEQGWRSDKDQTKAGEELIEGLGGQPYESWRKHRES